MKMPALPNNPKIFAKLPPTKGNKDIFMLPQQVNDILTKYAQIYLACQFTVRFFQYLQNQRGGVKTITSDISGLPEKLAYYKDNPANLASLQFKLLDAEKNALGDLISVPTQILMKPGFVGFDSALQLIEKLKPQLDRFLNRFFRKGKAEILRQSGFKEVDLRAQAVVDLPEVRALLDVLVFSEGTDAGYGTIVRGKVISSPFNPALVGQTNVVITDFSRHPQILVSVTGTGLKSTAAGRYQFKYDTWKLFGGDSMDFSPRSQDIMAVRAMISRGMIDLVLSGDVKGAINAGAPEWASLPKSNGKSYYSQPVKSIESLLEVYNRSLAKYK